MAVQIVETQNNTVTQFNSDTLERILLNDEVRNKRIVVLSIAGIFGKGKSFLLNYLLRYLYCQCEPDWMDPKEEPLEGFSWGSNSKRESTGLLMWSRPFLIPLPNDEEVVVILLDTQGTFDIETIVQECATVFSVSLLISSVQLFNLSRTITENDLQQLLMFTEHARQALGEDVSGYPFQKLQLMVRDWASPHQAPFGPDGGKQLFQQVLQETQDQTDEAQWMRQRIRNSFSEISCFLMPHPGKKVTTDQNYNGNLADTRPQFRDQLARFVPLLLSPQNLEQHTKVVHGQHVTASQLCQLFEAYVHFFSNNLQIVKPSFGAAADVRNLKTVTSLAEIQFRFLSIMFRGAEGCYIDAFYVNDINNIVKETILKMYDEERSVGGIDVTQKHRSKLEQTMDLQNESVQSNNSELEVMSEGVYNNIFENLKANLESLSSDMEEAAANLEGIGMALARYDVQNKLDQRIGRLSPAMTHNIAIGRRLAAEEDGFLNVIEDLCDALGEDSTAASQQASAKIEGIGISLAILSSNTLAASDNVPVTPLSPKEVEALYAKVKPKIQKIPRAPKKPVQQRMDLASRLTPREMRVLRDKKILGKIFPFYNHI